ncbi:hypothetical protein PCIT_b1180 [Pseudoalteromonas citrea]|uniref:Uncharacterized protein n=1 Tax=Pseudoalteromonas citrea TaxID=43655 RepID=A0AAD4FQF6_9GAMM|nr:hypothetical protein PCIT_b1180 [Pseudoalteromonas citrea]
MEVFGIFCFFIMLRIDMGPDLRQGDNIGGGDKIWGRETN